MAKIILVIVTFGLGWTTHGNEFEKLAQNGATDWIVGLIPHEVTEYQCLKLDEKGKKGTLILRDPTTQCQEKRDALEKGKQRLKHERELLNIRRFANRLRHYKTQSIDDKAIKIEFNVITRFLENQPRYVRALKVYMGFDPLTHEYASTKEEFDTKRKLCQFSNDRLSDVLGSHFEKKELKTAISVLKQVCSVDSTDDIDNLLTLINRSEEILTDEDEEDDYQENEVNIGKLTASIHRCESQIRFLNTVKTHCTKYLDFKAYPDYERNPKEKALNNAPVQLQEQYQGH